MKTIALVLSAAAMLSTAGVSAAAPSAAAAAVHADHVTVVAEGSAITSGELYSGTHFQTVSTKTREQVRAEVLSARERGELVAGEQYPYTPAAQGQGKTRAEVQAELAAYRLANPDPIAN